MLEVEKKHLPQSRDELFQREFYPLMDSVYAFAYRLTNDHAKAEDLTQETFLRSWRFIEKYELGSNAKAWLFRICKNAFTSGRSSEAPPPVTVDLKTDKSSQGNEISQALNSLSADLRTVVLLDVENFNYEEIAAVLDVPTGTVRSRLHTARKILSEQLKDYAQKEGYLLSDGSGIPDEDIAPSESVVSTFIETHLSQPATLPTVSNEVLSDEFHLLEHSRQGIDTHLFLSIVTSSPFTLQEWAFLLYLSEEALLDCLNGRQTFAPLQSARILEIARLLRKGESVFESRERFKGWLNANIPTLGSVTPKSLLDSTFGVTIVHDELTRIEHGVLA
jgi:RNA polymerase sigma-70 factor (ECF subfamily)